MPSADQVPIKSAHSTMLRPKWVVLIAGSTGSALRAVRPANLHSRRMPGVISFKPRGWFFVAATLSHDRPRHPCNLVGECDGGNLGTTPRCREPGSMPGAMDFGISDDGERACGEQATQIAIASFADAAGPVFAPTRGLPRHEADPGREVPS